MADIVISIKPEHAKKIMNGTKKFEFRKYRPRRPISRVYLYESSPIKKIVGSFRLIKIHSGSPNDLWKKCGECGGLKKKEFLDYCGEKKLVYGFEIDDVRSFDPPIDPKELNHGFKPPQSYSYITPNKAIIHKMTNQSLEKWDID